MTMNLFEQFLSTKILGIPLIALAILLPWAFMTPAARRWLSSRILHVLKMFTNLLIRQLILPLNFQGHKWALLFVSILAFILTLNLLGLLPYTFTPTTQLSVNLGLALPMWLTTVIIGYRNQPTLSLAHFLPHGTPLSLVPILILIETISLFMRPLALGVRLTANLTAGHLLIQLISYASFYLTTAMPFVATLTTTALLLLTLLEVAVGAIQAYVFVLLLSLYLQENT
uniref:ATP synthase subunit a n=1 Tax=Pseudaesopia japonica TaxID=195642 RepID=X2L5M0_9PLEU|nr:ATP synthase F0 subunit 6 [Pseudaesopia japonica]AHN95309.1 ATP synthase F0 subunit 6 [Pseudaesopia japonica]AID59868.1 ATP synthase F0 subunit 6 [Pseudaesopia japonica]